MKIINSIKDTLVGSFKVQSTSVELTIADKIALKNIIEIAKERIWLADPIDTLEYDTENFGDRLSEETLKRMKSSITMVEAYLLKNSTKE
tara:strand:- start:286 stop:555 length:270 start_codon:yes stop_codon:yes gene_type:complete